MTQKELDTYYIKVADLCSNNSKANRLNVGAILVKDQQIISDGFNGTPCGFENECEDIVCERCFVNCTKIVKDSSTGEDKKIYCESVCLDSNHILCKYATLKTKPYVLHAEANCLMKSLRQGNSTVGSTIYITHAPCVECSKLIIQAGVSRVVYRYSYKTEDGINILKKANIAVEKYSDNV